MATCETSVLKAIDMMQEGIDAELRNIILSRLQEQAAPKQPVEDLKAFAGKVCIDIFNDFDATEIVLQPTSIRRAWDIGRELAVT